ncbi:glycosyltransferase family A protein [Flavobacterium sp. ZB4P13]|uniref:glycosyltransferase family A protein n=1 Tax=Flavobacterium sp. ZB4P13 TaxID=3401728 RepID=UPI003AAA8485
MLAIVIPYCKLTFFEATLRSLASQTDQRFKVYIGDDASWEDPSDLLAKYRGKFYFVYHRFEENLGGVSLVKQWDRCIALSGNEEWIMILGDDDYLDKNFIASWYKHYYSFSNDSNVIRFATKIVNELSVVISNTFLHPEFETAGDSWYRKFKGQTRGSLSEYVFSKEPYRQFGFKNYPLAWHSDDRAWLDFSSGKSIYTINESIVHIRVSNISISGKQDNKDLKYLATLQFLKDLIFEKNHFFNKKQRLDLLLKYEVIIKRKLTLKEWGVMFLFYLKNFSVMPFFKFVRRFVINMFKL